MLDNHRAEAIQKLTAKVDKISDTDRKFFRRWPQRQFRVRLSHKTEILWVELMAGEVLILPEGLRWYTLVRCLAPGVRVRQYISHWEGCDTDVSEEVAAGIWTRAVEAKWGRMS
jgi:hypothetical protein